MMFFDDFDSQASADLEYGGQAEPCAELAKAPFEFEDKSLTGAWSPEED